MRVVINQKHLSISQRLARELNSLSKRFNIKNYSKIENIDNILFKRDISVEKKKRILVKKLHEAIAKTFSINKNKFTKNLFELMKKRLHNIRKIIIKLRSINYYLETILIRDLKLAKASIEKEVSRLMQKNAVTSDELEELEYTAYKLISEVVILDKRLLKEYRHKEKKILVKEKFEIKDLELLLKKESIILEHIEAKIPPANIASMAFVKEPIFTHWVARVFSLLSYLESLYNEERVIFNKLKRNKRAKTKISKKINHLVKEQSKLVKIMEEKAASMRRISMDDELKKDLHNFTTTINL